MEIKLTTWAGYLCGPFPSSTVVLRELMLEMFWSSQSVQCLS